MGHSKIILALSALSLSIPCLAQDELGLRSSNFSGVNRLFLNPAAAVYAPTKWSVNVIAAGVFINNKYAYIENSSGINALKNSQSLEMSPSLDATEFSATNENLYYNFYDAKKKMGNSLNAFATLPSFVFQKNGKSFGLLLNTRVAVSANRIDPDFDYFSIKNWDFAENKTLNKVKTAGMSWGEIGFHYGQNIKTGTKGQLNIGGTLKYLLASDGYFVKSTAISDVVKFSDSITITNSSVKYGVATGLEEDLSSYDFQFNGQGLSLDLGLEYKIASNNKQKPYQWKLGVSLIDLGFVRFAKNAQKHEIKLKETFDVLTSSYNDIESLEELYATNSSEVLNDPLASKIGDKFNITTPTAISFQVDYALHKMFYVNATINRRIRFFGPQVERENFIALTPRLEHKWLEVGMPLVLYNDEELRLGSWVRLSYLTIGSDNLSSLLFKQKKLHGSDIYFALNIFGFGNHSKNGKNKKAKLRSDYDCYF